MLFRSVYTYQIPSKPSPILSQRQNLFISSTNNLPDPTNLQNFGDEKHHYVSINSTIFNDLAEASHLIIFDLFRHRTILLPCNSNSESSSNGLSILEILALTLKFGCVFIGLILDRYVLPVSYDNLHINLLLYNQHFFYKVVLKLDRDQLREGLE